MIQVDVITIDNQGKRFRLKGTKEAVMAILMDESATFCLDDGVDCVWFQKQHVIRVEIRCLPTM